MQEACQREVSSVHQPIHVSAISSALKVKQWVMFGLPCSTSATERGGTRGYKKLASSMFNLGTKRQLNPTVEGKQMLDVVPSEHWWRTGRSGVYLE